MASRSLRVLLVEDDDVDALLVLRCLQEAARGFRLERTSTLRAGLERLHKGDVDVLLLDLSLPDSLGVETVRRVREQDTRVPIVVFTGDADERTALQVLQTGAQDYLAKGELGPALLRRSIHYARERRRMEDEAEQMRARLLEAQKHESLATLAGGIAHDFNNLLTVILTNCELVRSAVPEHSTPRACLEASIESSRVAAELTSQLLAYGGGGAVRRECFDLSSRVRQMQSLLHKLLPEEITLDFDLDRELPPIEGDPGQIQQVVLNLVTNARDAIGRNEGRISLATRCRALDAAEREASIGTLDARAERFVTLEVRDSGAGMDDETVARAFDPFFSTKSPGRGLGLAVTLGVARSHRGAVHVRTRPGEGTTFSVYLPAARAGPRPAVAPARVDTSDPKTVLVVDDEHGVREAVRRALRRAGHRVLLAEDGSRAVEIFRARRDEIDVVLLDLTMPGMSGERTWHALRKVRRDVPVVLTSGYDASRALQRFQRRRPPRFLQKPFRPDELSDVLRQALEASA